VRPTVDYERDELCCATRAAAQPRPTAAASPRTHLGAVLERVLDGRQRLVDALRVGHAALLDGHVEVDARQHALALELYLVD
jgi:hypothetical protein